MLSQRIIKLVGYRVASTKICLQTLFGWNERKLELIPANYYLRMNCYWLVPWGVMFCLMHFIHFYTVITDNETNLDPLAFATAIIQWGEIICTAVICTLTVVVIKQEKELMYFINQLIRYNNHILTLRKLRHVPEDATFREKLKQGNLFTLLGFWNCTGVAAGVCVTVMCPIEPCHVIYKEWLDIVIKVELHYVPFFVISTLIFYTYLTIIFYIAVSAIFFHNVVTSILLDITPTCFNRCDKKGQCYIMTPTWYLIEDIEVIMFYRTLQVFNVCLKNFMASILVSLHHVASLSAGAILIYFSIKYQSVVLQFGYLGCMILGGLVIVPFILVYLESKLCGDLVEESYKFRNISRRLAGRRMAFTKFANSCVQFNIPYAYPFYTVNRDTFIEFTNQVVDYTINLLLW